LRSRMWAILIEVAILVGYSTEGRRSWRGATFVAVLR